MTVDQAIAALAAAIRLELQTDAFWLYRGSFQGSVPNDYQIQMPADPPPFDDARLAFDKPLIGNIVRARWTVAGTPPPVQTTVLIGSGIYGDPLSTGAVDWQFTPAAYTVAKPESDWIGWPEGNATSQWVSTTKGGYALPGSYPYTLAFDLTGFDLATVTLALRAAADDSATVSLNGSASITAITSHDLVPVPLAAALLAGCNRLDFWVTNENVATNPTGLRVELTITGLKQA